MYHIVINVMNEHTGKSYLVRETGNTPDVEYWEGRYTEDGDHYANTAPKTATVINVFYVEDEG
jgi:hypothetical protein